MTPFEPEKRPWKPRMPLPTMEMKRPRHARIVGYFALLIFILFFPAPGMARLDSRCPNPTLWECYGMVEVNTEPSGKQTGGFARITEFKNHESLIEMNIDHQEKKNLEINRVDFYYGLTEEEIKLGPGNSSFFGIGMAFGYPLQLGRLLYPQGPESVPEGETSHDFFTNMEFSKKTETPSDKINVHVKATIQRINGQRIAFSFNASAPNKNDIIMRGFWDQEQPAPLPDDFDLTAWHIFSGEKFKTLKEIREKIRPTAPAE
ncbi:MAG: hypothetical protein HQL51_08795 [Magnetococcales bacterium]|nr:hypothetical protein [Magnetococcales bacterium]